jgi:soluble lytic murein transglycosylase-like protein
MADQMDVRVLVIALLLAACLPAQDSIARQMASVARQRSATAGRESTLSRQQAAVARQRAVAARAHPAEEWSVAPGAPQWPASVFLPPPCPSLDWQQVRDRFEEAEKNNELPAGILGAVATQESGLYPCAVSSAGAAGLMQLMPATAAAFGVSNRLALGAYNAGPARVDVFGDIPPIPETQNYVESVMQRMKRASSAGSPPSP